MTPPGSPQDAQTVTDVLRELEAQGYSGQLRAVEGARIQCLTCRAVFAAHDAAAEHVRRLEGVSDPADMLAVVALRCPRCATPATLVLDYGPDSSPEDSDVVVALDDVRDRHSRGAKGSRRES